MMKQKINASVRTSSLDSRAEILRMMKPAAEPIQLRRLRNAHFARREKILRETLREVEPSRSWQNFIRLGSLPRAGSAKNTLRKT